jgi:hypothetical protein
MSWKSDIYTEIWRLRNMARIEEAKANEVLHDLQAGGPSAGLQSYYNTLVARADRLRNQAEVKESFVS